MAERINLMRLYFLSSCYISFFVFKLLNVSVEAIGCKQLSLKTKEKQNANG